MTKLPKAPPHERILVLGSTPTSSALAAACGVALSYRRELHRVDLSTIVGKSASDTERKIADLIGCAEEQNWILFFHEADTLFGKRTEPRDSHDRHANIEINYVLERLTRFRGLVIFAVPSGGPIDRTLLLRFQRVIRPGVRLDSYSPNADETALNQTPLTRLPPTQVRAPGAPRRRQ